MATFDYSGLKGTAETLIAKFGQTMYLMRSTATGSYNPTISTTSYAATGVLTEYAIRERDGTLIRVNDKKAIISTESLAIVPNNEDKLKVGGVTHEIIDVSPLSPGGTTLIYKMQVRK